MIILPAIDIKNGSCVRLKKGNFNKIKIYNNSPLDQAKLFKDHGFDFIHIVDLDGALRGKRENNKTINKIINLDIKVQLGGGIRLLSDVEELIDIGVERVILSTAAVENESFVNDVLSKFDQKYITLALDFRIYDEIPYVATKGWMNQTKINLYDFIQKNEIKNVLATDINKDGLLIGPNLKIYKKIKELNPVKNLIGSGGISKISDVHDLAKIDVNECVVGKAIYENKISMKELANVN
jgi:phosphoribosylformimino-5-aminoimidazole carboxamide ribotide isomerase